MILEAETPVLPGTLLGFYPGVIMDKQDPIPKTETDVKGHVVRADGWWIDSETELPNVIGNGESLIEIYEGLGAKMERTGNDSGRLKESIEPEALNPFALGHLINHPPPDTSENVLFVDFDIPYTWFPKAYMRHIPFLDFRRHDNTKALKTVAFISNRMIEPGEELYVNYLED